MNKKILSLILTCLIIIPSSGLAAMPQFADRGEKSENKQQRRFAPAKQDDREDDREDDRQEKLREKLELRLLRDLEDALEDHDLENNNDDDNLDDDQMDALEDHQDQEHEEILNKKLRIKDLIKEKDREFFMQKPKKIQKIIKDDLKEFKQQNSKKYKLELESDDANIEIKIESPEHAVRILNLRNLSSSDSISGRIGETIEITSQDPKKIQLIFEVPSDQNNFILTINQEIYTINNLETKELSLDSNTIKEIELKLLTEKKLLKETRDYEFSNKENEIGERLAKINEKIANKQQCLELEDKLENMEFDGFENQAEDLFEILENNPNETICKAGNNNFQKIKDKINDLRFKAKKILFKDTAEGWFKSHVERISTRQVSGEKLFEGYKNKQGELTGEFGPLNEVRLGELLKVALKAAGQKPNSQIQNQDIDQNHWAAGFAQTATDLNLSISIDLSDLNRSVTRGQALQTFAEALMLINPLEPAANQDTCDFGQMQASFADFDQNHPQSLSACLFVQDGIIKGSEGNLLLDGATNRAEIAKILNNILDKYVDAEEIINEIE